MNPIAACAASRQPENLDSTTTIDITGIAQAVSWAWRRSKRNWSRENRNEKQSLAL